MNVAVQSEWLDKDYYSVLGVPETANDKEIQRAYRRLARKYHPDTNPDNAEAEERFKEISAAYDVVGDADKRKEYDEIRRLGPAAVGFGPTGGGQDFTFRTGGAEGFGFDLGDLFGEAFGQGRRTTTRATAAQRGRDLEAELQLGFEQAVFGVTTDVHLTADGACATCGGSGARLGTTPTTCATCGGSGAVAESQGLFSMSRPCPTCAGRGQVVPDPCADCAGRGTQRKPRRVRVRIPAGVEHGQLIRLPGRGAAGRNGGPPGDLFVTVLVGDHPVLARSGRNLTVTVPVTYPEAVLGAEVKVPTLDGAPVTVRIPPGTPSGRTLRVRGQGVPRPRGGRGDLLVTVEVAVPKYVGADERKAVEALAAAMQGNPRAHLGV